VTAHGGGQAGVLTATDVTPDPKGGGKAFQAVSGTVQEAGRQRVLFKTRDGLVLPVDVSNINGLPYLAPNQPATLYYEQGPRQEIVGVWIQPGTAGASAPSTGAPSASAPSASVPAAAQSLEGSVESVGVSELKLQTSDGRSVVVDTSGVDRQALRAIGPGDAVTVMGKSGASPDRFVAQSVQPKALRATIRWQVPCSIRRLGGVTMRSLRAIAVIVLLVAVAGCSAQMEPDRTLHGSSPSNTLASPSTSRATIAEGDVTRVDTGQRVIVLSNGQMYQVPADSMVYVNGQPVAWTTVQPGSHVMLTQGQLVELRDGSYMLVQTPGTVVTTPGVRQTVYGRVTDVDRNEIRVKTSDESFEVKLKDPKSAGIRKGDNVQIDMTFTPTSPSALPRK